MRDRIAINFRQRFILKPKFRPPRLNIGNFNISLIPNFSQKVKPLLVFNKKSGAWLVSLRAPDSYLNR
jgi:hypothetical protein